MSVMMLGSVAAAWGFVMALSPVLQVHRMSQTRSSQDVSITYFVILLPGFLLWVAYGIARGDLFIALPNAVAAVTALVLITYSTILRRPMRRHEGRHAR